MSKPKLTYFDSPASRGEECRLALYIAGVDFEDNRISRDQWIALKPTTPFGNIPIFDLEGHPTLGQSNAILALIGRRHGLHPKDDFEAARHEAMMAHVEDLRHAVAPTTRITDEAEKKKAREALAATTIPTWATHTEKDIRGNGPFFAGDELNVVDLKLYMVVRWFIRGGVDYVPTTIFDPYPKFVRIHDAVRDHARVKAWYARA